MRVNTSEIKAIKTTASKWFGADCIVRLFGSRVDDGAKGGDIDLHIATPSPELVRVKTEIGFTLDLQDAIGEQQIDVVVQATDTTDRPIDRIAKEKGIIL